MRFSLIAVLVLVALTWFTAPVAATAPHVYGAIYVQHYYVHGTTYVIYKDTKSAEECCYLCAKDEKCIAWTRDSKSGDCALKTDVSVCFAVSDVESGIKYYGPYPTLHDNRIGASFISVPQDVYYYGHAAAPKTSNKAVAVAVATASSSGGSGPSYASSHSVANPHGVYTSNSAYGDAYSYAAADNGYVSLASSILSKDYVLPPYVAYYYAKTDIVATCKTIYGYVLPFVVPKETEPHCYTCPGEPCMPTEEYAYVNGEVLYTAHGVDASGCCTLCRQEKKCSSWYVNAYEKICYLNRDIPEKVYIHQKGYFCGTVL